MKIVADYMEAHSGGTVTDALVQSSGKMVLIAKLLPKLKANGHKVCKERGGREGGREGRRDGGRCASVDERVGGGGGGNQRLFGTGRMSDGRGAVTVVCMEGGRDVL